MTPTGSTAALDAGLFHLRQLAYLREVARLDSFTRAAEALGVSQPALSQSLADLERRLGVPLFEPDGRHRRLTGEGREVLAFAERTLGDLAALRERLDARRRGEAGLLRVGMIDAASLYVLPEVIRRYRLDHPAVDLSLIVDTSTALVTRLRAFELDLAFVVGPSEDSDLRADLRIDEVLREPLYVYGPPASRSRTPPAGADWVLYPVGSRTRAVIDAGLATLGVTPRVALESHNPEVLRQMVALGLGWTVLPLPVAEEGSARGAPRAPRLRQGPLVAERVLVGVRRRADNPRVEAFLDLARERHEAGA